jgi:hypothetical protein
MSPLDASLPDGLPVPDVEKSTIVVRPPGEGKGNWAGAPSAVWSNGTYYLAYRMRTSSANARGYSVVVAASGDGVEFETLTVLDKTAFGAESLERAALVERPDGGWRIYVSCATVGSDHWWLDGIDAADPGQFGANTRFTVLPGDESTAVKDPVVSIHDGKWFMWVCCHPLSDPMATDRMTTQFASSDDGIEWNLGEIALSPDAGTWYERGTRIADVMSHNDEWFCFFDGRATKAQNAEEVTGFAVGTSPDSFRAQTDGPLAESPWGSGSLRYLSVVSEAGNNQRLYYEACLPDGSHAIFTQS